MAVFVLLCGFEKWTLTKYQMRKLKPLKFLNHVAGYSLLDRKQNENLQKEPCIFSLLKKLSEYRLSWFDHLN